MCVLIAAGTVFVADYTILLPQAKHGAPKSGTNNANGNLRKTSEYKTDCIGGGRVCFAAYTTVYFGKRKHRQKEKEEKTDDKEKI